MMYGNLQIPEENSKLKSQLDVLKDDPLRADLCFAKMQGAKIQNAEMAGMNLWRSKLTDTWIFKSHLSGANLMEAKLTDAVFYEDDLSGAMLILTNLKNAKFSKCDFRQTIFQPDTLPNPEDIAYNINLDRMTFMSSPKELSQLREALYENGMKKAGMLVNAAIQRNDASKLKYLIFDYTCEYGTNVNKPLLLLLKIVFIYTVPYFVILHFKANWGLYKMTRIYKLETKGENDYSQRRILREIPEKLNVESCIVRFMLLEVYLIGVGFLFSLLSSTRLGFREFNPNHLIKMLLPWEIDIKALGWPRIVSGFQSIISIILIATFLLSFFGWSFEF
jgi:hypothetical protein